MYTYRIIKEDPHTGKRGKRIRKYYCYEPLDVGGLYLHLGYGYPGAYRVLELLEYEEIDD